MLTEFTMQAFISLGPGLPAPPRFLHVRRDIRDRYGIESRLFGVRGRVLFADLGAARHLADRINEVRDGARFPELAVSAGELFAAGLLHEIQHLLIARLLERDAELLRRAITSAEERMGSGEVHSHLERFAKSFAAGTPAWGDRSAAEYLAGSTGGVSNREVAFEECALLEVANRNPALERMRELFDDGELREAGYAGMFEGVSVVPPASAEGTPASGDDTATSGGIRTPLIELLEEPMRVSPTSIAGQLRYVRERWAVLLGNELEGLLGRVMLSMDVLSEEAKSGFGGPPPPAPPLQREDLRGGDEEYERFSQDAGWMPELVLLAKSTFVWLDQLSRRYRREISTLDAIPDEELDELAERGFSGLWLIGLWERSEASRRIKQLRGQPDAAASAYALYDYRISEELGGEKAFEDLRERAWRRGIRLASDMVPNHVGIDGRWVIEHPERFISLDHPPYPAYRFSGPDLSSDSRVEVYLEDHYYDNSDAAVVFKRVDSASGEERYIYHGNDGTAMPWNDTAQLDYLNPQVREAVIATVVEVAKRFPIIRFDAAMTLAKRHVRRLWYPAPGEGGAIPSRSEYGSMSPAEFDQAMPEEFWREVVDRVATEAPDTLLLAEAFWMMEGYFVRTLGMHRVYNSAFMNMLKREANDEFRLLLRNVLEFEPEVLGRFVNFMNNPDEDTAVSQFGKGDKYFGVCTLMCTLPGLPMFGHGQVEGFEEKYGMEFRRALLSEQPDEELVARHREEIFPLLHRRREFAGVAGFRLYDFIDPSGNVNEDVIAYSNRSPQGASLVVYNNRYAEATGRLRESVPFRSGDGLLTEPLAEALGLESGADRFLAFRDRLSGLEHLLPAEEVREGGLEFTLGAYGRRVFTEVRTLLDSPDRPYRELWRRLAGRGVPDLQEALDELRLMPLYDAWGDLLDVPLTSGDALRAAYEDFLMQLQEAGCELTGRSRIVREFERLLEAVNRLAGAPGGVGERVLAAEPLLVAWLPLVPLPGRVFREYGLAHEIERGEHIAGSEIAASVLADTVALLLRRASAKRDGADARALLAGILEDEESFDLLGVHEHDGEEYFVREPYRLLTDGLVLAGAVLALSRGEPVEGLSEELAELRRIEEGSDYRMASLRDVVRDDVRLGRGAVNARSAPSGDER